jgi:DNA-binding response OmpR family regulator
VYTEFASATRIPNGLRVLVVDDYYPIADLVASVLWKHGYEARAVYSASDALHAGEEFKPHAAVLDVILPDVEDFQFVAEFERRFPECRVLLTSAWDFVMDPPKVRAPHRIVRKAVLMEELLRFLESSGLPADRSEGSPEGRVFS